MQRNSRHCLRDASPLTIQAQRLPGSPQRKFPLCIMQNKLLWNHSSHFTGAIPLGKNMQWVGHVKTAPGKKSNCRGILSSHPTDFHDGINNPSHALIKHPDASMLFVTKCSSNPLLLPLFHLSFVSFYFSSPYRFHLWFFPVTSISSIHSPYLQPLSHPLFLICAVFSYTSSSPDSLTWSVLHTFFQYLLTKHYL